MLVALDSQRGGWRACGPPEGEGPQWPPPLAALSGGVQVTPLVGSLVHVHIYCLNACHAGRKEAHRQDEQGDGGAHY